MRERLTARDKNVLEVVRKGEQMLFRDWAELFLENYSKPPIREPKDANKTATPQEPEPEARPPRQIGPDGFPIPPRRIGPHPIYQAVPGQRARMIAQGMTMTDLAGELESILKSEVIDETGLKAKYEFMLAVAGGFGRAAPVYAVILPEDSSVGGSASSRARLPRTHFRTYSVPCNHSWASGLRRRRYPRR